MKIITSDGSEKTGNIGPTGPTGPAGPLDQNPTLESLTLFSSSPSLLIQEDNTSPGWELTSDNGNLQINNLTDSTNPQTVMQVETLGLRLYQQDVFRDVDNNALSIYGGTAYNKGAGVTVCGDSHVSTASCVIFTRGEFTESARFDTNGNFGIGNLRNNLFNGSTTSRFQVEGTNFATASGAFIITENSATGSFLSFNKSRGSVVGNNTIVQNGDNIGGINFSGNDGTGFKDAGSIRCYVDNTPSNGSDMPGRLSFWTSSDGASSPTERMRITSLGDVTFNGYAVVPSIISDTGSYVGFQPVNGYAILSRDSGNCMNIGRRTTTGDLVAIWYNGGLKGSISTDGTNIAYNTSSDRRLKRNIHDLSDSEAIQQIMQIKPRLFEFKESDIVQLGFIADELQQVVPTAVTGEPNEVDDDGDPKYQMVDYARVTPILAAAIQSVIRKTEEENSRLTDQITQLQEQIKLLIK